MAIKEKKDTHSYKGWLNSDSFWKRAFAVYGYGFIAGIIVIAIIYAAILFFALLFGVFMIPFGLFS